MKLGRRQFLAGSAAVASIQLAGLSPAAASPVQFDANWDHLTFRRLAPNSFQLLPDRLTVVSDGASSILYRILPQTQRGFTTARWTWEVETSVPPSDLSQLGNDDRNLGMFFVSMPADQAARVREGSSISSLLRNRAVKVLMYTWGGNQPPGTVVPSPHAPDRLRNLITRRAEPGRFTESVDLRQDFPRVFGQPLEQLVAVAVSSNSENSSVRVLGHISGLVLG